mgnify:CR=1 FL=1
MTVSIFKTFFDNKIKLIKLKKFNDKRGFFIENYNENNFKKISIKNNFDQDNESFSKYAGTLRGLHFQKKPNEQAKLISVKMGSIFDVFIDIRKNSKTFGVYKKIILKSSDNLILYIPHGFAHGFCTLENNTIVNYKPSDYYYPKSEITIKYNDKTINIKWPNILKKKFISNKDLNGIKLLDYL